ncbi:unnamed protein product [Rotaria sp. Silwood1]|nr:unnamed protein product [Rotaria sp. Silwood1]
MKRYSKMAPIVAENITFNKFPQHRALHYHTILSVAPFPYMPDPWNENNNHLLQFIQNEFNAAHPGIYLILRPMNTLEDFYNLTLLEDFLTGNDSGYDVVEIDTVILGDLVAAGIITPQTYPILPDQIPSDWHPAAGAAVQINQAVYAFPHLMCAYFLFTHGNPADKREFLSLEELERYLNNSYYVYNIPNLTYGSHRLVGNLNSSWDISAIWIDSQRDIFHSTFYTEAEALHGYEHLSFEPMRKLAKLCESDEGVNDCVDGKFEENYDEPAKLFGTYAARAMFGYSERLFHILKESSSNNVADVKIQPLPLGTGAKRPVFFTDAYVFRRNLPANKLAAAQAFVKFMATPRMQAAVVGNEAFSEQMPLRYLLPISKSAYNEPLLVSNRFYQDYFRNLYGYAYPNTGLLSARRQLAPAIRKYIKEQ